MELYGIAVLNANYDKKKSANQRY